MALRPIFTWEGRKYHVGQLKVTEIEDMENTLGCRYVELMPLGTMRHKIAFMRVFLGHDHEPDVVAKILDDMTLAETDKCWGVEEDDLPEMYEDGVPTAGEPSTVTS
jgi:hypothetical protein